VYATFGVTPTMNDDWSSGPTGKESFGRAPTPCTVASRKPYPSGGSLVSCNGNWYG
jgi:hypothetical protein